MSNGGTDMRAALLDGPGALRIGALPVPDPGPGQVRVRVEACGLNPVDYQVAAAAPADWTFPHVLGLDVVGVVDAAGEDVPDVRPGERVAYHGDLRRRGGFAEFALADAAVLAPVPAGVDPVSAACLPAAGMTAYQALVRRLHVGADDVVLITAAAGGVGGFAVQLARLLGARVLATASERNAEHVRRLGADEVIDYRVEDVAARVRELTGGRGVDAVVDTVGPESATANLRLLAHGGGLAAVAGRPDPTAVAPFTLAPSIHEIALGAAYSSGDERSRADLPVMLAELLGLLEAGRVEPMLNRAVDLADLPAALDELAGRHVRGKLVLAFG
ncbi:zinc-binding dehydrogenase [Saccharopolyspora cebuensis]|uniref:Zinc-binding dehydrogenase n=1 Tax=Saccharopolyspora cebuensis TaxID=418759 RepID=A0ABV4CAD6_9PSEU